jgi:hypothetical protein
MELPRGNNEPNRTIGSPRRRASAIAAAFGS